VGFAHCGVNHKVGRVGFYDVGGRGCTEDVGLQGLIRSDQLKVDKERVKY